MSRRTGLSPLFAMAYSAPTARGMQVYGNATPTLDPQAEHINPYRIRARRKPRLPGPNRSQWRHWQRYPGHNGRYGVIDGETGAMLPPWSATP